MSRERKERPDLALLSDCQEHDHDLVLCRLLFLSKVNGPTL